MAQAKDFRVSADWDSHVKFIKISRVHGAAGPMGVFLLWGYATKNRSRGVLYGMDEEDILIVCKQPEEIEDKKGSLIQNPYVQDLVRIGFLDRNEEGELVLHNWERHNPWVADAEQRSRTNSENAKKGWDKRRRAATEEKPAAKNSRETGGSCESHANRNAPSPSLPSHKSPHTPQGLEREIPVEMILELWNSILHELDAPVKGKSLEKMIEARIQEEPERRKLEWWKELFLRVARCPELMGFGTSGWKTTLGWVVNKKNLERIEAGGYREQEGARQTKGWTEEEYEALQASSG